MKEEFFIKIISEISKLCYDLEEKESNEKNEDNGVILELDDILDFYSDRKELDDYLIGLTNTTLNTICALMDFGRRYENKVLPINLDKYFNKYYLPYWFEQNKGQKKEYISSYLADKSPVLPRYLNRAKELLFYSKNDNIELTHECGGSLCLEDSDGIEQIDSHEYELHLACLKCGSKVNKIVDKDYLNHSI
ncbi:MAG: hypothetical protein E6649_16015 [Paeniclostridium sordellii]|nr:hypothetical protein [Paeniclostridium sordellii]